MNGADAGGGGGSLWRCSANIPLVVAGGGGASNKSNCGVNLAGGHGTLDGGAWRWYGGGGINTAVEQILALVAVAVVSSPMV
ncbi:MAG: hypothetical protein IPO02_12210 [Bacteroidetes bacterium]|nr:hypothetical protein [Bacteroidota bacterium]